MDDSHYLNSHPPKPCLPPDDEALPELTEDVERLLTALQEQELDVDQRVLNYAHKA
ncbi:MAG: hypothetical protein LBT94_00555 [Prevotellaceae bacterium]|jgi:hypothetical protein|nr:hypothetical protein [Prevotellaceae bacterium]